MLKMPLLWVLLEHTNNLYYLFFFNIHHMVTLTLQAVVWFARAQEECCH